jgi:DNA-binding response OmpR family regulator
VPGPFRQTELALDPGSDRSVLIVEDEALIALGLEEAFEDQGLRVAGPFATCSDAMAHLRNAAPAVAVLDAMLRDGPCLELARELRSRKVPFLIYSGRSAFEKHPLELEGVMWIDKPAPVETVVRAVIELLRASAKVGP